MTGAWQLTEEKRVVLLFANVSDRPIRATLVFDAVDYALPPGDLQVVKVAADERGEPFAVPRTFQRELDFPPHSAWAWEITQ